MGRIVLLLLIVAALNPLKAASQLRFRPIADSGAVKQDFRPMPQKFYTQPLGFFCKKEVQLQRITRLPVFIRVGSKEYVDRIERKGLGIRD